MKIREILLDVLIGTHLFEMAFERKRIITRLTNYQDQINLHAIKIIIWSDTQDVPHWKQELTAWGNQLARMTMRTGSGLRPMGFDLPWKHLYLEPFDGVEETTLTLILQHLQQEYTYPITKTLPQIMTEYTAFIRPFCQAIGSQQTVGGIVNTLGQTAPTIESIAAK